MGAPGGRGEQPGDMGGAQGVVRDEDGQRAIAGGCSTGRTGGATGGPGERGGEAEGVDSAVNIPAPESGNAWREICRRGRGERGLSRGGGEKPRRKKGGWLPGFAKPPETPKSRGAGGGDGERLFKRGAREGPRGEDLGPGQEEEEEEGVPSAPFGGPSTPTQTRANEGERRGRGGKGRGLRAVGV